MRILAVCLGNICRSPLAHGLLEAAAEAHGLPWEVDSAGTGDYHVGEAPDPRSVAEAARHGLDIGNQRARRLTAADLASFDHVLVMDATNLANARALARTDAERAKVELVLDYAARGTGAEVPDPYWDDDGFAGVYDVLAEAVEGFVRRHGAG